MSWADAAVTAPTDLNARRHAYTGVVAHLDKKPQLPIGQTVTTWLRHDGLLKLGAIRMRGLADQDDRTRGVVIVVMAQAVPLEDVQNLGNEAAYARRYHDRSKCAIAELLRTTCPPSVRLTWRGQGSRTGGRIPRWMRRKVPLRGSL